MSTISPYHLGVHLGGIGLGARNRSRNVCLVVSVLVELPVVLEGGGLLLLLLLLFHRRTLFGAYLDEGEPCCCCLIGRCCRMNFEPMVVLHDGDSQLCSEDDKKRAFAVARTIVVACRVRELEGGGGVWFE